MEVVPCQQTGDKDTRALLGSFGRCLHLRIPTVGGTLPGLGGRKCPWRTLQALQMEKSLSYELPSLLLAGVYINRGMCF